MANKVLENSFKHVDQSDLRAGYAAPQGSGSGPGPISESGISDSMSVTGAARAALVLFAAMAVSATWMWTYMQDPMQASAAAFLFGGLFGGVIIAFVMMFKPHTARICAPLYALAQGLVVGGISKLYESQYDGIIVQAVLATGAIVFVMYALYSTRILKVTERFRKVVIGATLGIMVFYGLNLLLSFFGASMPFIWDTGAMGIGFSLFVIAIAASNLALDFDFIEKGSQAGLPKYMNWAAAFGLLATVVWIYLEMLRLLAKMRQ